MDKVLIHDGGAYSMRVHVTKARFGEAKETVCGEKLHPISTLHADRLPITCPQCLAALDDTQLKRNLELCKDAINRTLAAAVNAGLGVSAQMMASNGFVKADFDLKRGLYNIKM